MTAVLSRADILKLLQQQPPLLECLVDMEAQLQPDGVDLTLREIAMLQTPGAIPISNRERVVSSLTPLMFDGMGYVEVCAGAYLVTYNEIVHLPRDVMALGYPRSSLLRCGVAIHNAVWDAGYSGRSQSLMVVYNERGFRVQKNARIEQLVFLRLTGETEGYKGTYQGENV